MKLYNRSKHTVIADELSIADSFFSRFLGLMGRKELPAGKGLLIIPCSSIHMFFMRFSLDILFVDKTNQIVFLIKGIKPWRTSRLVFDAVSTIELPIGTIDKSNTEVGDRIEIL